MRPPSELGRRPSWLRRRAMTRHASTTLLLVLAAARAAPEVHGPLDDESLARLVSSRTRAVLKLDYGLACRDCRKLDDFWNVAGEHMPPGTVWRGACETHPAVCTTVEEALGPLRINTPSFIAWDGRAFSSYAGPKELVALSEWVKATLLGTSDAPTDGATASEPAFREAADGLERALAATPRELSAVSSSVDRMVVMIRDVVLKEPEPCRDLGPLRCTPATSAKERAFARLETALERAEPPIDWAQTDAAQIGARLGVMYTTIYRFRDGLRWLERAAGAPDAPQQASRGPMCRWDVYGSAVLISHPQNASEERAVIGRVKAEMKRILSERAPLRLGLAACALRAHLTLTSP